MKILLILLGIVAALFIAIQIFAMRSQNDIENYPYTGQTHGGYSLWRLGR